MDKKIISILITALFFITSIEIGSAINITESYTEEQQPLAINMTNYNPEKNLGDLIDFKISISDDNDNPISFSKYKVYTIPYEKVTTEKLDNTIQGKFTATKEGIYSLITEIECKGITYKEKYFYIVNPKESTIKYYFRDINPTHGQPGTGGKDGDHSDCKALVFDPPTEGMEYWRCGWWVQSSPDEIPENMPCLSILKSIDTYFWYQASGPTARVGVQKHATFGPLVSRIKLLNPTKVGVGNGDNPDDYTWTNKEISSLYWPMLSNNSWYFLSIKVVGYLPKVMTIPEQPSYAEFHYLYFDKVKIKSNSNPDIEILSVTSELEKSNNAEIILGGSGTTDIKIQMSDKSLKYSTKFNNAQVDFTQENGELFFDNLYIDPESCEHTLNIFESDDNLVNKQFKGLIFFNLLQRSLVLKYLNIYPKNIKI